MREPAHGNGLMSQCPHPSCRLTTTAVIIYDQDKPSPRVVAARLRELAALASEESHWLIAVRIGPTFTVRCMDDRASILACAERFERGFRRHPVANKLSRPTLRRPLNADAMLAVLESECQ